MLGQDSINPRGFVLHPYFQRFQRTNNTVLTDWATKQWKGASVFVRWQVDEVFYASCQKIVLMLHSHANHVEVV
jgi:hypothetical protein